jgi:hypothetical protein
MLTFLLFLTTYRSSIILFSKKYNINFSVGRVNSMDIGKITRDYQTYHNSSAVSKESGSKDRKTDLSVDTERTGDSYVSSDSGAENNAPVDEKELSILFYMKAAPDVAGECFAQQIVDMESVGSTDDINLVVQLDRKTDPTADKDLLIDNGKEGTRRYLLTENKEPDFAPMNAEKMIELAEQNPDSPHFHKFIADRYKQMGETEKMQEHMDKFNEAYKPLSEPEKLESKHEFGINCLLNADLSGFERNGLTEIKSEVLQEFPNAEPGKEADALKEFVEWGMENYPAKNHILVIGGHGLATLDCIGMTPAEMSEALTEGVKNANEKTGREDSIDSMVFNSCFMGNIEVVTELKDNADIILTDKSRCGPVVNYLWDDIITQTQDNINETGNFEVRQFANDFVDRFKTYYEKEAPESTEVPYDKYYFDSTSQGYLDLAAIDTKKIPDLLNSFNKLLKTCKEEGVDDNQLFKAVVKTNHFGRSCSIVQNMGDIRDLGGIIKNLHEDEDISEAVKEAAENVLEKLDDTTFNQYFLKGKPSFSYNSEVEDSSGLSIWAPNDSASWDQYSGYNYSNYYKNVPKFTKLSDWDNRLREAADNIPPDKRRETVAQQNVLRTAQREGVENIPEDTPEDIANELKEDLGKFYFKVQDLVNQPDFM